MKPMKIWVDRTTFRRATIEAWRAAEKDPNGLTENGIPNYVAYPNTDWEKEMFNHGIINDHNVSITGGTDKLRVLMSAGYLDNPGLVDNTGIRKYSLRANIEADITKWLTVGTRTFASQEDKEPANFDNANEGLRSAIAGVYPIWNGQYGAPEGAGHVYNRHFSHSGHAGRFGRLCHGNAAVRRTIFGKERDFGKKVVGKIIFRMSGKRPFVFKANRLV